MAEVRIKETSSGLAVEVYEKDSGPGTKPLAELTCEGAKLQGTNRVSLHPSSGSRKWEAKTKNQGQQDLAT